MIQALKRLLGVYVPPPPINLPPIDDECYGRLSWDSECRWWQGSVNASDSLKFRLLVSANSDEDPLPSPTSKGRFKELVKEVEEIQSKAIEDYWKTFREYAEQGEDCTYDEFFSLISPDTIQVHEDGAVEVSFDCKGEDDPLGGHAITARIKCDGTRDFGLEG